MNDAIIRAIVIIGLFVGLLFILARILKKKITFLISIVNKGAKLEFTTIPGWVSLITVVIIAMICALSISLSEVTGFLFTMFEIKHRESDILTTGIVATVLAAFANFIFIAFMRPKGQADKDKR